MILEGVGERIVAATAPITPRGRVILLLASLLGVLSFFEKDYAAKSLLFFISITLYSLLIVSRIVFSAREAVLGSLRVERRLESPSVESSRAVVRVYVENPTPISLDRVEIYDNPPQILRTSNGRQPVKATILPAYGSLQLEYDVRLVIGRHKWGPLVFVFSDWLGFFRVKVERSVPFTVEVKPRTLLPEKGIVPATPFLPPGVSRAGRKGSGVEFYSLREYMPEDDIRLVDWKAYARLRKLFVKEYEQEAVFYTLVVVDVTPSLARGVVGETKLEYSARIAASMATYLARRGDYYRLVVINPSGVANYTPWLRGRRSHLAALRLLGTIEWPSLGGGGVEASESTSGRARIVKQVFSRILPREKTIIIFISDFAERRSVAEEYAKVLGRLASLKHEVMAIVPLTVLFESRALGRGTAAAVYRLLARQELVSYRDILRTLRSRGVIAIAAGPRDLASYIVARLEAYRGVIA